MPKPTGSLFGRAWACAPGLPLGNSLHLGKLKPRFLHLLNGCEDEDEDGGFSGTEWSQGITALPSPDCLPHLAWPWASSSAAGVFFFSFFRSFWVALHSL